MRLVQPLLVGLVQPEAALPHERHVRREVRLVVPVQPLPVPPEGERAEGVGVLLPERAVLDEVVDGGGAAQGGPG